MAKIATVPNFYLGIEGEETEPTGVFLTKEDCKLLATELSHYGCFNEERREAYNAIINLVFEVANED